jgi:plastocyanin
MRSSVLCSRLQPASLNANAIHKRRARAQNLPRAGVLNKGPEGFDEGGDSLALAPKGPHKSGSVVISAPAGTTLYYMCAIHPWMQGKIVVT